MIFATCVALAFAAPGLTVKNLRTEYLVNPIGLEERSPRFFWVLDSQQTGQYQAAYRVIVASSPTLLNQDKGDLWDTGKVASRETIQIEYNGKQLQSRERAWWKVLVWDKDGAVAKPAQSSFFEMGLLSRSNWQAKWIGMPDAAMPQIDTKTAQWVWYPEGEPQKDAPTGDRWFRTSFELSDSVTAAELAVAVDDTATLTLNGMSLGDTAGWTDFTLVRGFRNALKQGQNELVIKANNEQSRAGLLVSGHVVTGPLDPRIKRPSRITKIESGASWETSKDGTTWTHARELAPFGGQPYGVTKFGGKPMPPPMLRRQFQVRGPVKRARVYSSARGVYELYLDGKKVSADIFRPGWTDYKKRIQYQAYDVTKLLTKGDHALGMIVGDGWFVGHVAWAGRQNYGPKPMGLAQLEIDYADGTREIVASDAAWAGLSGMSQDSYGGPIRSSDMLMGETYDARLESDIWAKPWADNVRVGGFVNVEEEALGPVPLVPQVNEPVRVLDVLSAKKITEPKTGAYVFDLGQNMVGWVRLRVQGPAGSTVTLRHAEMLNPDGTLYTTNLRRALATDTYTLRGGGVEVWEPRFTFHGFRYVEVTGFPGKPTLDAIKGIVIGSDSPRVGSLTTSNALVNQLQHNIFWGQRGNYLEAPTDCPQRDERLGWMGDAQVFIRTATFNNDVAAFMTKWTQDVEDTQSADGAFADVAPKIGVGNDGAPAWGDAGVIVPWTLYQAYGDKRLLARRYGSMKRWVDYIHKNNADLIWTKRVGNNYGDWLNLDDETPKEVVATAYFANSARILGDSAAALGRPAEATVYHGLARRIVDTFFTKFVTESGTIKGDTQTAYVLALAFEFPRIGSRQPMVQLFSDRLRAKLASRKDHLSTGFMGAGYLNNVVSQYLGNDLAYKLLLNEDYPGWLYPVKNGATTIWERWDGWTDAKGFQDPGMNSFNHYSYGAVGEWMYKDVGGLGWYSTDVANRNFMFTPTPGAGVSSAKAAWDSILGRVECEWKKTATGLDVTVQIPPNCAGSVRLPGKVSSVTVNGSRLPGVSALRLPSGRHTISVVATEVP